MTPGRPSLQPGLMFLQGPSPIFPVVIRQSIPRNIPIPAAPAMFAPCAVFTSAQRRISPRRERKMSNALPLKQNTLSVPPDEAERRQALDPECSFIVQAPAGSGKTGLLIQRYLKLLTCVEEPEEVGAITFRRTAASEMRQRLVARLTSAQKPAHPSGAQEAGQATDVKKV